MAPSPSSAAPAPASSVPAAGPLGTAAYQAELTRIDQALAGPASRLTRVRTAEGLSDAMNTLAEALNTVAVRLAALKVTSRLDAGHSLLQVRIGVAATQLTGLADETEDDARCGGVAYTSQNVQRQLRTNLSSALVLLQQLKLTFGKTLPNPGPAPAQKPPDNGDILVRRGPNGTGQVKITNGTAKDVAVSIVTDGQPPSSPQVMVYIQATKATTVKQIGGAYHLYFKSGSEWDPDRRKFRSGCTFKKFAQTFGRNQGWQVNLKPMATGNATTTEVEAY
ncbi:hypothetical protein [Kribbella kalugense]|uniref:hypothetical protein n=1 Tax=Kribbella kalugense TaxID=2512221 RepID=UPI001066D114|nr:hypothetical protein [Kribbella kalugense]